MTDKKLPKGIPLKSIFDDPDFQRHYEIMLRENPGDQQLRSAITNELILQAREGNQTNVRQSKVAQELRPVVNDEGEPLDDVIQTLAANYLPLKPKETWPHLAKAITEWSGCDCTEKRPNERNPDSWRYVFTKKNGAPDSITYQTFRKKLRDFKRRSSAGN